MVKILMSDQAVNLLRELAGSSKCALFGKDGKWRVDGKSCSQVLSHLMRLGFVSTMYVGSNDTLTRAVISKKGRGYLRNLETQSFDNSLV